MSTPVLLDTRSLPRDSDFRRERATRFHAAMSRCPHARDAELGTLADIIRTLEVRRCRTIVDLGAGDGYATAAMLPFLAPDGIAYAIDGSPDMLERVVKHPQVQTIASRLDELDLEDGSVDLAITLGTFHHVVNKNEVAREVKRVLRHGGHLIVVDVYDRTPTQRFFDEVVRRHCVTGHDLDFVTGDWMARIAERAALHCVGSMIASTPWRFDSEPELLGFLRDLFCLDLSTEAIRAALEDGLRPCHSDDGAHVLLPWTLGCHVLANGEGARSLPSLFRS